MRRGVLAAVATAFAVPLSAQPAGAAQRPGDRLDAYTAVVQRGEVATLIEQGFEVFGQREVAGGLEVGLVATADQRDRLEQQGVDAQLTLVGGQTVKEFAAAQAQDGYQVWRSWDEPGGFRDQMSALARENPGIAKLVRLGATIEGREMLAIKLTDGARRVRDGRRPAVLYNGVQHAREWIAGEVSRRLMHWYVARWRAGDREIRRLLKDTELWFVPIANPDGYEYTFDVERLWRKNLRDNDGNGVITVGDGIDLNRNYPSHFHYDEEGSGSTPSSEDYRGAGPASEPETRALMGLHQRVGFSFQLNYHSTGEWLLYPGSWQIGTPTADDPIYFALSGNLDRPAIPGFNPGLSADLLYMTHGDATDYAHSAQGTLAWSPELGDGCPDTSCGSVFPDDEAAVQAEFDRNLPFALSVARSADDPGDPESSLGIRTKPFYIRSDDPYKAGLPGANFAFRYSYGDPQPVQVLAKRSLGRVTLNYRINGGRVHRDLTWEWRGGERYASPAVHYRELRGVVRGTDPGDSVEVWFEAKGRDEKPRRGRGSTVRSESFTYQAVSESAHRVLVVAAEDYTGTSPLQAPGPHYLHHYLDALQANGIAADVYDVDARGRTAPDHLGVLSHYDAVVWYTGDDFVTRPPGWPGGNADRLAMDQILEARAYMNEGGRVLYTGKRAGQQYSGAGGAGTQFYDPKGEGPCTTSGFDPRRCLRLGGTRDQVNDVLTYWFGAYMQVGDEGDRPAGGQYDLTGVDAPFAGLRWALNGPDSADNQVDTSSFVATSGFLPPTEFPLFDSWPSTRWDKPPGPLDPHSGTHYVYSQSANTAYKRLTRTVSVPASGGSLSFWTFYDVEPQYDFLFVEARSPGGSDWTTLPDANGHTSQDTGLSCREGWRRLHPHLDHYQTRDADGTCSPMGDRGGAWHAATGTSSGWQQWSVDLTAYAGETVEISIAYVTDHIIADFGVVIDDVTLPDGTSTSFESDLDGWVLTGPAEGSGTNANDFIRRAGFAVGASITTPKSIIMGYGVEGIATPTDRATVIGRALGHLLPAHR